jgi:hypothetical protein
MDFLIPKITKDYMKQRPHGALKGLTPMESYAQKAVSTDYKTQIRQAKVSRIEHNRKTNCTKCN